MEKFKANIVTCFGFLAVGCFWKGTLLLLLLLPFCSVKVFNMPNMVYYLCAKRSPVSICRFMEKLSTEKDVEHDQESTVMLVALQGGTIDCI